MSIDPEKDRKLKKLKLLQEKQRLAQGLPYLHGMKHYHWSRKFYESTNDMCFLTASNQIGKSSASIRKCINMAIDQSTWQKLWPKRRPFYFFYFYPSIKMATREFTNKWVTEFLPRGEFKDDPIYGWKPMFKNNEINHIAFNSGINVYFLSYEMDVMQLQASSPSAIFADEEMPERLFSEIITRLVATEGLFSLVCTPTLGEPLWESVFEGDKFPNALKIKASMYDCLEFEDGSPGLYTLDKINKFINTLPTQREIDVRVFAKFSKPEGRVYESFDDRANVAKATEPYKEGCLWYSGVDIGGGGNSHPAAICFVMVRSDFKKARVVKTWKGNKSQITTAPDILNKYLEMRGMDNSLTGEYYDYASKDFGTVATRAGVAFQMAEKSHEIGVSTLNSLFKNGMLTIDDNEDNKLLIKELNGLRHGYNKNKADDHIIDALRYATSKIPWNFSDVTTENLYKRINKPKTYTLEEERKRGFFVEATMDDQNNYDQEFDEWNELYEG